VANLQTFSILVAVTGGTLLTMEQEVDFSRTSNSTAVDTVLLGYAGESPGAPMLEVDIHSAMPSAGLEFDAGPYIASLIPVPIQVTGPGGKSMKGDAFIISDNGRHGVNQQARYSFRMRAPLALFQ
jgi:hypothetical protein